MGRPNQRLLGSLISLKELGLERFVLIARYLQFQKTNSRSQFSLVAPVAIAPPIVGVLSWLCLKMLGHFSLQTLVHDPF